MESRHSTVACKKMDVILMMPRSPFIASIHVHWQCFHCHIRHHSRYYISLVFTFEPFISAFNGVASLLVPPHWQPSGSNHWHKTLGSPSHNFCHTPPTTMIKSNRLNRDPWGASKNAGKTNISWNDSIVRSQTWTNCFNPFGSLFLLDGDYVQHVRFVCFVVRFILNLWWSNLNKTKHIIFIYV